MFDKSFLGFLKIGLELKGTELHPLLSPLLLFRQDSIELLDLGDEILSLDLESSDVSLSYL